jgi:protein-tyrosine kinase
MAPENAGIVAMRGTAETNAARPEPVVEFARKKSSAASTEPLGVHQAIGQASTAREFFPSQSKTMAEVALPRDNRKPLVTSGGRHAKEALEAYRSLRTRLLKAQATQGFRSIVVTSVGKSDGKTLTAFNLACCCAQVEDLSVLLIDGDLQNRSLTELIGGLPSVGLADVMNAKVSCEDAIVKTDVPNLYVMGAGSSNLPAAELFATDRWSQVIRWSSQHFKIVLVDALSIGASADFELLAPECDGILLVVRAQSTPREALKTAMEQIDANKLVGVVWNGSKA